ncbi:MAG: hypothetical protein ACOZBW_11230 [Thermodesulfobacteriota bacterium]
MGSWKTPIPADLCDRYCLGNRFAATVLRELICRARNQPGTFYSQAGAVFLERGQAACGREELAACCGLRKNEQGRIRTALDFLEKTAGQIAKRKTRNGSVITILFFDEITCLTEQTASPQPNNNQTGTSNKNGKSAKNGEREQPRPRSVKIFDGALTAFVDDTMTKINFLAGSLAPKRSAALEWSACDTIDRLIRLDGFTLKYVVDVITWAIGDDFWQRNLLSLASLRKPSKNGLTKFQNIAAQYENDPRRKAAQMAASRDKSLEELTRRHEAAMSDGPGCDPEEVRAILRRFKDRKSLRLIG